MCAVVVGKGETPPTVSEDASTVFEGSKGDSRTKRKHKKTKCDMRTVESELCTRGGTGLSNGWYFDPETRTCEDTQDYGSCSASGPFKTKALCKAAVARGECK